MTYDASDLGDTPDPSSLYPAVFVLFVVALGAIGANFTDLTLLFR
jgi:hypothetical protein